jgi:hypothetical protein
LAETVSSLLALRSLFKDQKWIKSSLQRNAAFSRLREKWVTFS